VLYVKICTAPDAALNKIFVEPVVSAHCGQKAPEIGFPRYEHLMMAAPPKCT